MRIFPTGSQSVLSRVVAAEVRARLAAERISQRDFAGQLGFSSHNYLAIRLRDEKPFTLDDIDRITQFYDEDPWTFVSKASESHADRIWDELGRVGIEEPDRSNKIEWTEAEKQAATMVDVNTLRVIDDEPRPGTSEEHAAMADVARLSAERRNLAKEQADARDMSSFENADLAARNEDAEKPKLSD